MNGKKCFPETCLREVLYFGLLGNSQEVRDKKRVEI